LAVSTLTGDQTDNSFLIQFTTLILIGGPDLLLITLVYIILLNMLAFT